jgi:ligand-binding sensor domain-containing protein
MALLAHAGKVWVGTLAGLERLDPATGGHDVVLRLDPQTARDAPWQALAAGPDGAIWYGSAAGLYRIGQRGGI